MSIRSRSHRYTDGETSLEALVCWDDNVSGQRPGVLVSHAWRGRSAFENGKAEMLAGLGYVGFALDLYGAGVLGKSPEENQRLMQPFLKDRQKLLRRLQLALREAGSLPEVDAAQMAAIGFCFGGLCVLDLARSGAGVRGVVSFHGLLTPPPAAETRRYNGKVLVLHGWDDPMAPPEALLALTHELSELGADWQVHAYGNTLHAFSNPDARDPAKGLQFDAAANSRSQQALQLFLGEVFN